MGRVCSDVLRWGCVQIERLLVGCNAFCRGHATRLEVRGAHRQNLKLAWEDAWNHAKTKLSVKWLPHACHSFALKVTIQQHLIADSASCGYIIKNIPLLSISQAGLQPEIG